ncbi:MAG TPA: DUF916 domain-containing protein [Streptosporangiaceae bacterium]|jgi:hypothetical protein
MLPARPLAILTALAAMFTLMLAGGPAQASPAGAFPFGLIATPTPAGTPRPYFNVTIRPGQSVIDHAIITNQGDKTETLLVLVSKGVTAANSGSAYQTQTGRCSGADCWVSGLPPAVTLPAGTRRLLTFKVEVPRRTAPGQYLTGLTATPAVRPRAVKVGGAGRSSAKAIIIDQVTVGVAITVGNFSTLRGALKLGAVSAGWIGPTPRLYLPVRNTGQRFERATGHITCQTGQSHRRYRVIMETVLPGGHAVLPVNARGLAAGSFSCAARLTADHRTFASWSGTVRLLSAVTRKVYHPATGVFVALPSQTTPSWAIALFIVGGLILAAILVLLIRTRRKATTS